METNKQHIYEELVQRILAITADEHDEIALMATVVCELHQHIDYFDWTGFYRVVAPNLLKIGPYQGTHGCLQIHFDRGVCGAAARTERTQIVDDVTRHADHIACSSSTRSEIVVPVFNREKQLIAVFDVDSNREASFDEVDQKYLETIMQRVFTQG